MARSLRIIYPGAVYHATSRGNAKQDIFCSQNDRILFLDTLEQCVKRYGFVIHAFCLMNNHYHLLVETPNGNLSDGMRHINQIYTQKYNFLHNKVGHLFQGRFKASIVERDSHLLEVIRYVANNPVRAGYVESPADYIWSSYRQTAGLSIGNRWLSTSWVLDQFSGTRAQKQAQYMQFVNETDTGKAQNEFAFGSKDFVQELGECAWESDSIAAMPLKQRSIGRPPLSALIKPHEKLESRNQKIREAHVDFGYKQTEIASYLNLHPATISRIVSKQT